jgi:hypothetical protein
MDLSKHAEFEAGNVHTDFISQHGEQLFPEKVLSPSSLCQAVIALVLRDRETSKISYRNSLGLYMTELHTKRGLNMGFFPDLPPLTSHQTL